MKDKAKCVDVQNFQYIRLYETYEVTRKDSVNFYVICDDNRERGYPKICFEIVPPTTPEQFEEVKAKTEQALSEMAALILKLKEEEKQAEEQPQYEKWDFAKHMKGFVDGKIAVAFGDKNARGIFLNALAPLGIRWKSGRVANEPFNFFTMNYAICFTVDGIGTANIDYYKSECKKIVTFEG